LYLPFSKLPRFPNLANFENFRKAFNYIYNIINRLTSGKTYVDTFSAQSVFTPIDIHTNVTIGTNLRYTSDDQIPTIPQTREIISIGADYSVNLDSTHQFVKGMPLRYTQTGGTRLGELHENRVYWVKEVTTSTSAKLAEVYGGDTLSISTSAGTHTLRPAYPMMQIEETFFTPRNNSLDDPEAGVLAYGDVYGTKSTLYYHNGSGFTPIKLGWPGGEGYYNNNGNDVQKYTGWCHGNGHYKVIVAANQIKLQFDWLQVVEDITASKNIVSGLRTNPVSDYNVLLINSNAGLNSIDTGITTANTGYYLFFVYNPTTDTYGCVYSLSPDKPTFPTDSTTGSLYNSYQRLGWFRTDASGNFLPSLQVNDKLCFFTDPGALATISFLGGGTSSEVPLITANTSNNAYYPLPTFINSTDLMLETVGTSFNNDNVRTLSLNQIPMYEWCPDTTSASDSVYMLSDFGIEGTNVDFSVAHPEDTGGTDYSAIDFKLMGFRFDKGELHV